MKSLLIVLVMFIFSFTLLGQGSNNLNSDINEKFQQSDETLLRMSIEEIPEATSGFDWPLVGSFSNNGGYTFLQYAYYPGGYVYHPAQDWNQPNVAGGCGTGCNSDKCLDVLSVANGKVVSANTSDWGGIVIQHNYQGQTWYSQYGHVFNRTVSVGDNVTKGQKIAEIGTVGTDCAHLHFEIRESDHPDPTYGAFWSYSSTSGLNNASNVENWYEDPAIFIPNHPAYSTIELAANIQLFPNPLIQGSPVNVTVQVKNDGPTSWNGNLALALHSSNGSFIADIDIENNVYVGVGEVKTVQFYKSSINSEPGSYQIHLKYENNGRWNLVPGGNYSNPISIVVTGDQLAPDLIVEDIWTDPINPEVGESTTLHCRIKNIGTLSSGEYRIRYYIDGAYIDDDMANSLEPGASDDSEEEYNYVFPSGGNFIYKVVVEQVVNEINTDNNERFEIVTVGNVSGLPDLIVSSVFTAPTSVVAGDNTRTECTIKNQGSGAASSSKVYYYLSDDTVLSDEDIFLEDDHVTSLDPNETSEETQWVDIPVGTPPGDYFILFYADGEYEVDESDENNNTSSFGISVIVPEYVTVITPNGGENWQKGTTHTITWDDNFSNGVKIELYKGSSTYSTIVASTSSDGSYNWTIPTSVQTGTDYRIKITSSYDDNIFDMSDGYFTISEQDYITVTSPNGGENWLPGTSNTIKWNSNAGGYVDIELYKGDMFDVSIANSTINDGTFSWSIPSGITEGSDYKVKIKNSSNGNISDISDDNFTIAEPEYVTVITPNGGEEWQKGTTHSITWEDNFSNGVKIQLYKGSDIYSTIVASTLSDGSYNWTIPTSIPGGTDYRIKITSTYDDNIFDMSDVYFTISEQDYINVTSPNGGESWIPGTGNTIKWSSNAGGYVDIELYKGDIFNVSIANSTINDGTYSWSIPSGITEGSDYKVKIKNSSNGNISDISDDNFTIAEPEYVKVITPNGGEEWQSGSNYDIIWNDNIVGNVKIELYDGNTIASIITTSTSSTGVFNWTIPTGINTGTTYRIKITSLDNSNLYDYSDNYFAIVEPLFSELEGLTFIGVYNSSVSWGDYDNDGDLDILLIGTTGSDYITKIYKNQGSDTFEELEGLPLVGVTQGSVAWGDYDNDGDLDILLTGYSNSGDISKIYKNQGGDTFEELEGLPLVGVYNSSVSWGDYDNDGDLDISLTGYSNSGYISKIYKNQRSDTFEELEGLPLVGVDNSSVSWGDYDNDGDLDILLTGYSNSGYISKIYKNQGGDTFEELEGLPLIGVYRGAVSWGDYDNDGDLDIFLTGTTDDSGISKIYKNQGGDTFEELEGLSLIDVKWSSGAWGDYDNDSDLDILLTGYDNDGVVISKIYKNNSEVINTKPNSPENLITTVNTENVTFTWTKTTDNETPQNGLNYNLVVGTQPGSFDIVSPMSDLTDGYRRIAQRGLIQSNTSSITGLEPGTYYWSVQAVDAAFSGGEFAAEKSFTIVRPLLQSQFLVNAGWNIVSVPLEVENGSPANLFPSASSSVFGFDAGYFVEDTLQNGAGYWLKYPAETWIGISGFEVENKTVEVTAGWNLIGFFENPIQVSNISAVNNSIASPFYAFNGGYEVVDILSPGKGYWLKTNSEDTLYQSDKIGKLYTLPGYDNLPGLTFSAPSINPVTLYFGSDQSVAEAYDLPPVPPSEIPDVRFTGMGHIAAEAESYTILIQSNVTLEVNSQGINSRLTFNTSGGEQTIYLRDGKSTTIPAGVKSVEVTNYEIPTEFVLYQNYPNPFNPSTTIKFGLPEDNRVRLEVYNILGEKVATLINEEMMAGYHEYKLNAHNFSSGIYFYHLSAGSYRETKKMLMVK
ncbi:MAG: hypothetical protein SCALA702_28230 [Melioribacteraceae bacterium]|nr:MAG: hypothetical protein SCALA702_28230 [Melioribacteraceae bacterium]